MKKTRICVLIVLTITALGISSCTTTGIALSKNAYVPVEGSYSDENVSIAIVTKQIDTHYTSKVTNDIFTKSVGEFQDLDYASYLEIVIQNKTSENIRFDVDQTVYSDNGHSARLVTGQVIGINANIAQPKITIVPGSFINETLFLANNDYKMIPSDSSSVYVTIEIGNEVKSIKIDLHSEPTQQENIVIGTVSGKGYNIKPLFLGYTEGIIQLNLTHKAKTQYGDDVKLQNIRYNTKWHFTSLLFNCSTLGYVEKWEATAEVVKK